MSFRPAAATRLRNFVARWVYAAGNIPEIPFEPKNPFAQGEAVKTVHLFEVGDEGGALDISSDETVGCMLKYPAVKIHLLLCSCGLSASDVRIDVTAGYSVDSCWPIKGVN